VKSFWSLLLLYLRTTYDPARIFECFRQGPKGVAKGLLYILLFGYLIVFFVGLFILTSVNSYFALKPYGLESAVILNGIVSATAVVALFGFLTALATYFVSGAEQKLLSLPVRPRSLFAAKFLMTYVSEAALALLILAASMGVYAWFEHPGFLFYLYAALIALCTPLLPLAVFYLVLIPLMRVAPFMRRRGVITAISLVVGIGLALGWQLLAQRAALSSNGGIPPTALAKIGALFPPALWAGAALDHPATPAGLASLGAYLGLGLGASVLVVLALGRSYATSLLSFGEAGFKRLSSSAAYIRSGFGQRGQLAACLRREVVSMNRETVYVINGPFMVFFMPIVLAVTFFAMGQNGGIDLASIRSVFSGSILKLIAFGYVAFMGSMTNVAATAVSREGTQLAFIKSLPLEPRHYAGAKLAHAFSFSLLSALVALIVGLWLWPAGFPPILMAAVSGLAVAALMNTLALYLDFAWPHLTWTTPQAAMKQNPNTMIALLGGMAVVAGLCVLAALFLAQAFVIPLIGIGCFALTSVLALALPSYARERLERVEV
jgi:ABC-2 type transport system permease protein